MNDAMPPASPTDSPETGLEGLEVAITGRLASMSREEARDWIRRSGGSYVRRPGAQTALLVVGEGGPPLDEEGRPTRSLRAARALREAGSPVRVVSEEEFLTRIGRDEQRDGLRRLYTTAQLARILDVPAHLVRAWVRHELIRPAKTVRRLAFFEFRQVATAKAIGELARRGVTPGRIRRSLAELAQWLPEAERALAQLETFAQGGTLLVRTDEGLLAEPSGQLRIDFQREPGRDAQVLEAPTPSQHDAGEGEHAVDWFEVGLRAEEAGLNQEAVEAYRRAADAGGPQPETAFNLGNALYALQRFDEAATSFAQAAELEPDYVEAWNNLGNALGEADRPEEALPAYRRALALEPDYADAHFNLAETLAALGRGPEARPHWEAYLEQDPSSPWADVVRRRLGH